MAALNSWTPDGQTLLYTLNDPNAGSEIWKLPLAGDRTPSRLLTISQRETNATVSPDGKWLAFQSNRAGLPEIYLRPFPSGPGQWQVSTAGARSPRWRGDGKELFFLTGRAGNVTSVDVTLTGATPQFGATKALFPHEDIDPTHPGHRAYAVSRDGQRFVISRARDASTSGAPANSPIAVVVNWLEAIRK